MMTYSHLDPAMQNRVSWNAGKTVGTKRPLTQKQIWAIRFFLDREERLRDRALFDLAIDSKLRGCDLVNLKIGDLLQLFGRAADVARRLEVYLTADAGERLAVEIATHLDTHVIAALSDFALDLASHALTAMPPGDVAGSAAGGIKYRVSNVDMSKVPRRGPQLERRAVSRERADPTEGRGVFGAPQKHTKRPGPPPRGRGTTAAGRGTTAAGLGRADAKGRRVPEAPGEAHVVVVGPAGQHVLERQRERAVDPGRRRRRLEERAEVPKVDEDVAAAQDVVAPPRARVLPQGLA